MKKLFVLPILFLLISFSSYSQSLIALSPNTGAAGNTITAILSGQNTFFMSSSPQGLQNFQLQNGYCRILTGSNFVALNEDSVQVQFTIPAGYVNGVYDLNVVTGMGQSLGLPGAFLITGGVNQSIQGFSPSTAFEGTTINAQVTGQNLQTLAGMPYFTIQLFKSGAGIPGTVTSIPSAGQLNVDFIIPPFVDTGYYRCQISVLGGCFVLPNAVHVGGFFPKQLLSISPASGNAGATLTALVTGQNTFFMSATGLGIQNIKITNANCNTYTGTNIGVIDNDHLNVDFNLPADASNGQYDLTVKIDGHTQFVLPAAFTINNGVSRDVTLMTPSTASAGTTFTAAIDGAGLADIIAHPPVTIRIHSNAYNYVTSTVYSMSGSQLMADFVIPAWSDNGFYTLEINSGAGCYTLSNAVQVTGGIPPAILSITPNQGIRGQTLTALMTGQYAFFMSGTQTGAIQSIRFTHLSSNFFVYNPDITYIDSNHVNLNITIPPNSQVGYYGVQVTRIGHPPLYLNPGFEVRGTLVSGNVYLDVDSNGIFSLGDVYLPNQEIHLAPDNVTTFTDQAGNFSIGVEPGLDTIAVVPDSGWVTTAVSSYIVNIGPNDTSGFTFGVRPLTNEFEVLLDQSSGNLRCNMDVNFQLTFRNNSTTTINGMIWWLPDSNLNVISNNPPPTLTSGDTLFWAVTNLYVQQTFTVQSIVHTPGPGVSIRSYTCADGLFNGNVVASACDSIIRLVGCSFDPNDKSVEPEGILQQHYVLGTDYLEYQIRFQNTGNDTAYSVSVFDTLSQVLDISTFELITSTHPVAVYITGRVVEFRFNNIMLPDSNVNEAMSHGFVKFRIKPASGFLDGSVVNNSASIHFDLNAPVLTNTVTSTVVYQLNVAVRENPDGGKSLILYPNPTQGLLHFELPENQRDGKLFVIDQTGRKLKMIDVSGHNGEINLGNYPPGIYTIILLNKDGIMREKVVIY